MRRAPTLVLAAMLTGLGSMAVAADAPAPAKAAAPAGYSVSSTLVGKLLDDPASNAVLKKMIPSVYANDMFQSMGRDLTLKDIQQYEPEALSDENLAKLQAELDKLSPKG